VAIWIALVAAALAVPRPSPPAELPAPEADRKQLAYAADDVRTLAAEARQQPLAYDVRAAGELLRLYGRAEARGRDSELSPLLADLRVAARAALARHPARELAKLEAVQTELFSAALRRWEDGEESSRELEELAGNLPARAREHGWWQGGRLLMSEPERRVVFRVRWAELTGLRGVAPFAPTLDDWRIYYGFLLEHPEGKGELVQGRKQLEYVTALSRRDPSYPRWLARGVVQYQLGAFHEAADAFVAHLAEHPDGAYALRAKNHLLAALAKAEGRE
jgi:hypothetical protein